MLEFKDHTFALQGPGDFFAKLEWEFAQLKGMPLNDGYLYQVVTCASDAWHMADWAFAALSEEEQASHKNVAEFRKWLRGENRSLAICRMIADAHKHSKVDRNPDPNVSTRYILGPGKLEQASTTWLIVDDKDLLEPRQVIEDAVMFWVRFLGDRNMLAGTPIEDLYHAKRSLL